MVTVWEHDAQRILEMEAEIETLKIYQADRIGQMVGTTELAEVIGVGVAHAYDIRNGTRNLPSKYNSIISAYVRSKIRNHP